MKNLFSSPLDKYSSMFGLSDALSKHHLFSNSIVDSINQIDHLHNQVLKATFSTNSIIDKYLNSPAFQAANAIPVYSNNFDKIFNNSAYKLLNTINSQTLISKAISLSGCAIPANAISNKLASHLTFNHFHYAQTISNSISKSYAITKHFNDLESIFSFKLMKQLEDNTIPFDDVLLEIETSFKNKAKKVPEGSINFDGMVGILLSIIMFIYSTYSSIETEKKILNSINEFQTNVIKYLEALKPQNDEAIYYVIKRPVNLRVRPTTKSEIIRVLFPNQKVELIKTKGRWIYVEYFDYLYGIPRMGWVYKKYTKRID